jgi:hypothetical protein
VQAAVTPAEPSTMSQNALYWPPDMVRYNMESLIFLSSDWMKTACVLSALFWYDPVTPE